MPRSPQEVFQHHAEAQGRGRDRHVHLPGRADPAADGSVHAAAHEL